MAERLWVCHDCELIGSAEQAERHELGSPECKVEVLSEEMSDAVRAEQRKQSPWPNATDWIAIARLNERIGAAPDNSGGDGR